MKHFRWSIAKNATANIVRGGATALVAIILPHFLAHDLQPDRFAAWSLMLQIAAYASFLDFGLQATVARTIAQALELEQGERARRLFGTAFALLSGAALVAILLVAIVLVFAHTFFQGIPMGLLRRIPGSCRRHGIGHRPAASIFRIQRRLDWACNAMTFPLWGSEAAVCWGAAAAVVAARYGSSLVILAFLYCGAETFWVVYCSKLLWSDCSPVTHFGVPWLTAQ